MYSIKNKNVCVRSGSHASPYWIVAENLPQERAGQRILEKYLVEGCAVLGKEIAAIADTSKPFTQQQVKRVEAMFVLLVDARKAWQEEDASIRAHSQKEPSAKAAH